jgi:hypothetical protein
MKAKKDKRTLIATLGQDLVRWKHLYENGGSDPAWADGCNLNLVRNHIICCLQDMEKSGIEVSVELPPEVDNDYMAKPDEIRNTAAEALKAFENDEHLQYLLQVSTLTKQEKNDFFSYDNVVGYYFNLKEAIKTDDLVTMRRYRYGYLESFKSSADCIRMYLQLMQKNNEKTLF